MTSRRGADALGVGAAKLAVSLAVLAGGFRAVSDDDYARVVIAQRFAEIPKLDPSGTSWLPLPFWIYGAALRSFGGGLATARVVAVLLGVGAALLLLWAAQLLANGRLGALAGALIAAALPWSAWLGAATVPELPAAALVVYGAATLTTDGTRERVLGAAAVAAACFCRYEAWPIALVFAAFTLLDARRSDARALLVPAAAVLGPIALWLLHGVFMHGDALFFWKRVAGYRQALGGGPPLAERLLGVPRALVVDEPELWLGLLLVVSELRGFSRYRRPAVACLALLAFLIAGELSGGGPTHHAGRAVLPVWLLAALALGDAIARRAEAARGKRLAWLGVALALVVAGWVLRSASPPGFPDRGAAVDIGARARELGAPALLIDTPDYAYLAVTAAFGAPELAEPFDDHDPRHTRPADPFASAAALSARWATQPTAWLVVTSAHKRAALAQGSLCAEVRGLALVAPNIASR